MGVNFTKYDNKITAHIIGDIDHHCAKNIRTAIDIEIESNPLKTIILDFKDVSFMDSSGIGLVMRRYKLARELNCDIKLINLSSHIKKVMKLAGLDRLSIIEK